MFLEVGVEVVQYSVVMHQRPYLDVKPKGREFHSSNCGEESLPEPQEGALPPVDQSRDEYETGPKAAQTEV
eukprot:9623909-Prorocentrum_lima.AAC.1